MATRKRKPINREPLPFKAFILGSRKYRVIRWGDTVKGQKHLIVKNVMTLHQQTMAINPDWSKGTKRISNALSNTKFLFRVPTIEIKS